MRPDFEPHPRFDFDASADDTEVLLRDAQELAQLWSFGWDMVADVAWWSPELEEVLGPDSGETTASLASLLDRIHPEDRKHAATLIETATDTGEPFEAVIRVIAPDGGTRWLRGRARVVGDRHGGPRRLVGVCQDVTAQKEAEERLTRLALHDPLTHLANRTLFLDRLGQALRRLGRGEHRLGLLFVDLDRFKGVNDTMGHAAGDEVLVEVAARLGRVVRPADTIGRFGGDEFAILCEDVQSEDDAASVAQRLLDALAEPMPIGGRSVVLGASIGIALTRDATVAPEALLRDADAAMYRAKEAGRGTYVVFDHATRARLQARQHETDELRLAIDRGELAVHFQPAVDLATEAMAGVEALVRWNHPTRGLLAPEEFIPLAEQSGLVVDLGTWVLWESCRQLAAWQDRMSGPLQIAVNLSAHQLGHADLIDTVRAVLRETGLAPQQLCLEITETVLMDDVEASIEALLGLRLLGVRVAIDDFGTGYSSLSYLRRFPVDVVKIDRSFVTGLGSDAAADAIVAAVVNLSHALGLQVVAEGVEREEQLVAVRAFRCDQAQGFLWSPPLPIEDLCRWVQEARPARVANEQVDIRALLEDRTQALRDASGRPVVLQGPNMLLASGDTSALRSVVDHLLGNAIRYSADGAPVVVSADSDRRWVRVSVTDYGVGMTNDEQVRCFEQFWQGKSHAPGVHAGTGVGLYIVRSLVEAMEGHVGVKSTRNKGSTFTFALPRLPRAAARSGPVASIAPGVGADSSIREFMRQIGVPNRRGS